MFLATHGVLRSGGTDALPFTNTKSIELDGLSDHITLNTGILTAQDFSLSIWFKGGVNTGAQQLIAGSGNFWNFGLTKINGAGLNTDIAFWNGSSWISLTNGSTGDNQWHNLVVTFEDTANNLRAYYDGNLTFNGTYDVSNSDSITGIGYNSTFGRYWEGFIDEVAIWTSELSQSDITAIYGSGVPTSLASLSPLSWWRADGDTSPTITDNGSGGNNGTMTNFSTFSTDVPLFDNKSFEYDGVSDKLDLGNPTSLQITGNITLSAWINTTSSNTQTIIGKDSINSGTRSFLFFIFQGNLRFTIYTSSETIQGTTTINDGSWHHVLGVNDGTDLKIYVDGVLEGTNSGGGGTIDNGTSDFNIGSRDASHQSIRFNGKIDEPAVFDYALTSSQVLDIFSAGTPDTIASLNPVGHWRAENGSWDGSKWTITDVGSGGNDAESVSMVEASRSTDVPLFDNKSFEYDGVSDYLEGTTTYSELDGVSKASFSVWLKPNSSSSSQRAVFMVGMGSTGLNSQVSLFLYEGVRIQFNIETGSRYGRADINSINYNNWNHLLITVDFNATPEFKCFVNGVDETTSDNMSALTSFPTATESLYLGEFSTGQYTPFLGGIDEFAIWSGVALTSNDVANIYNSGVANDLNNNGLTAPTTWIRSESSTWDGSKWTIDDENSSYQLESSNMTLDSRTSDVPT